MDYTDKKSLNAYLNEISGEELLSNEQENVLAERIRQGDTKALNELTSANLRYVVTVAKQYIGRGLALEDLISEGNIGMIKAAARFDAKKGKRFVAFAAPFIRKQIEQALDEQTGLYRIPEKEMTAAEKKRSQPLSMEEPIPAGSQNNFNLLNVLENEDSPLADKQAEQEALAAQIETVINVLDEREQTIIRHFFGIGAPHLTMMEIGTKMGLRRERVRQIRDKAVRKLRKANSHLAELQ